MFEENTIKFVIIQSRPFGKNKDEKYELIQSLSKEDKKAKNHNYTNMKYL